MKRGLWAVRAVGYTLILLASSSAAWAQGAVPTREWGWVSIGQAAVSTLVFGLIGVVMASVGFKLFDLVSPFNLEREICEKQNIAVSLISAAMVLGICVIIAAAVL
jgi:hypothetical protein